MEALFDVTAMGLQGVGDFVTPSVVRDAEENKVPEVPVVSVEKRKSWADEVEEQETLDAVEMINEVVTEINGVEA